jgi:acylphosphatase
MAASRARPVVRTLALVMRRHVWVAGRVQGVWFRQSCAEQARLLRVAGWVRNASDGRVEAVFEGDDSAVAQMVSWCHSGPVRADVTHVEVLDEQPEGFTGFSVRGWG